MVITETKGSGTLIMPSGVHGNVRNSASSYLACRVAVRDTWSTEQASSVEDQPQISN
jgi:hypothetical protein